MSPKSLAELIAKGMVFNEIAPAEFDRMKEKVKPVVDKHAKDIGERLITQTYAEIEKVRQAR